MLFYEIAKIMLSMIKLRFYVFKKILYDESNGFYQTGLIDDIFKLIYDF